MFYKLHFIQIIPNFIDNIVLWVTNTHFTRIDFSLITKKPKYFPTYGFIQDIIA